MFVLVQLYHKLKEFDDQYRDRRVDNLPFANNPLQMIIIIALYYGFIKHWGPKLMKDRAPFELKWILLCYNALQVVGNFIIVVLGISLFVLHWERVSICMLPIVEPSDLGNSELGGCYSYMMLKFVDLLDTIFLVLRKRDKQFTFLHVYHHMIMALSAYAFFRYLPGGHANLVGLLNSYVHTVMYFYYFISALQPQLKQSLWWKKHITQIQIIQFIILLSYSMLAFFTSDCQYPRVALVFILIQDFVMLVLFSNFYYKTYVLKPKQTAQLKQRANDMQLGKKMKVN